MAQKEYISPKELAKRLEVSYKTLEKWRYLGIGPSYLKIGGCIRYSRESVEDFIKAALYLMKPGIIQYFSEKSLAMRWDFAVTTLRKWRLMGKGPEHFKIGRYVRYRHDAIKEFETQHFHLIKKLQEKK